MRTVCKFLSVFVLTTALALGLSSTAFGSYEITKAFAFGADNWTRATYNDPSVQYIKVAQDTGLNWTYSEAQGHGFTYAGSLDNSSNNRGDYTGDDEIYDQFVGVKKSLGTPPMLFRVDVENAKYRFVAAGGDADNNNHSTTIRVRDGDAGTAFVLVDDWVPPAIANFYTVEFEDKVVPPFIGPPVAGQEDPAFLPQAESPILEVTQGFLVVEIDNIATSVNDSGGDICLIEIWRVSGTNAGPDQTVTAGDTVTLVGVGPDDATSYLWEQIAGQDRFTATLTPSPNQATVQFTTPVVEIGFLLRFKLTVVSPTDGTSSDTVDVKVMAPNYPKEPLSNVRVRPLDLGAAGLGVEVEWDPIFDATAYEKGLKSGDIYIWLETTAPTIYRIQGLTEGQPRTVVVRAVNGYGSPDPVTEPDLVIEVTYIAMRNLALPATAVPAGKYPPLDPVQGVTYVISHYAITGMNDKNYGDTNDSWNGEDKAEDFWGYEWPNPMVFNHLVYVTGNMFGDGGWFTSMRIQYTKDGTTWVDVPGMDITPAYDFTDVRAGKLPYTRYDIAISPVMGTGVRIYGTPGGTASFTSIAELEVFGNQQEGPLVVYGADATVNENAQAALDGSHSFSTRGPLSGFAWVQTGGPTVSLTDANQAVATFTTPSVDADVVLTFEFTAGDGTETDTDEVTITVKNLITTAVAGPDQKVLEGTLVNLDGTGSVSTSPTLTYAWTQTGGTTVTLTGANTATPSFTAPVLWNYNEDFAFQLEVNDGVGGISTDSVTVNVKNILEGDIPFDPWGFKSKDISGTVSNTNNIPGASSYDPVAKTYSVTADGTDMWGNDDGCRFLYKEVGSDFESISVRIDPPLTAWPDGWTKVSIMARQDLDANSKDMYLVASRSNGMVQQYRTTKGGAAARQGGDAGRQPYSDATLNFLGPVWLKLERQGDVWVGYYSYDGLGWVFGDAWNYPTQHTIPFTAPFYVGLALTSHTGSALATAIYGEVKINNKSPEAITDAYAIRELPISYEGGGVTQVNLSVRVNPASTPTSATIVENIPAGIPAGNVSAPGATVAAGKITWNLTGANVKQQTLSYSLTVPEEVVDVMTFDGTVTYSTTTSNIFGEDAVYPLPTAPRGLVVQMLQAAHLDWSPPLTVGTVSYNVYRSVNGGAYELIASTTNTSYTDKWVSAGNNYAYEVSAVNGRDLEGPLSRPTAQVSISAMDIRESEDFNYGGGQYPGYQDCPAAIEAPDATTIGTPQEYDFFHLNTGGPNAYRPANVTPDGLGIETGEEVDDPGVFHTNIGWVDVGSWYRYTYNVPEAGWIKLEFRVAAPSGGTLAAYWDEVLVGTVSYNTGNWHIMTWVLMEDQIQTTTGVHTLRVESIAGGVNLDKHAIQWNAAPPARKSVWEDNFDSYATTADVFSPTVGGWTRGNTTNSAGSWTLWDTAGPPLGSEDANIAGMEGKYMISDSDMSGAGVAIDEEMLSPEIDCTTWTKLRLNFNYNYRMYDDLELTRTQDAEVDVRSFDPATGWSNWTNLLHLDRSSVPAELDPPILSGTQMYDLSAYDGKKVQLKFHFFNAEYDYWFAFDKVAVSGVQEAVQIPLPDIVLAAGNVTVSWDAFAPQYTVEYTADLKGTWTQIAGPFTQTSLTEAMRADKTGYYRVVGQ